MTTDEIQAEITGLKNLLSQTDYRSIRTVEQFFLLFEGGITFTKLLGGVTELIQDLADGFRERQSWRDRIDELEATEPDDEAAGGASDGEGAAE